MSFSLEATHVPLARLGVVPETLGPSPLHAAALAPAGIPSVCAAPLACCSHRPFSLLMSAPALFHFPYTHTWWHSPSFSEGQFFHPGYFSCSLRLPFGISYHEIPVEYILSPCVYQETCLLHFHSGHYPDGYWISGGQFAPSTWRCHPTASWLLRFLLRTPLSVPWSPFAGDASPFLLAARGRPAPSPAAPPPCSLGMVAFGFIPPEICGISCISGYLSRYLEHSWLSFQNCSYSYTYIIPMT